MTTAKTVSSAVVVLCFLFLPPAGAQAWRTLISSDITVLLTSTVEDQQLSDSSGMLVGVAEPHANADLVAFHRTDDASVDILAYDIALELPDGLLARQGDVVRLLGSTYELWFSPQDLGLAPGTEVDAFTVDGSEQLMSFNVTTEIFGVVAQDEDLVQVVGTTATLLFDGSVEGIARELDLDGAHLEANNSLLFLSFDGSETVGGLFFEDEDVLAFNLLDQTWSMWFSGESIDAEWSAASIDAVALIEDTGSAIFADGFESGAVTAWN